MPFSCPRWWVPASLHCRPSRAAAAAQTRRSQSLLLAYELRQTSGDGGPIGGPGRRRRPGADVALLDRHMPGMGGLDLCRVIAADARLEHLRIVKLTSAGPSRAEIDQSFELARTALLAAAAATRPERPGD